MPKPALAICQEDFTTFISFSQRGIRMSDRMNRMNVTSSLISSLSLLHMPAKCHDRSIKPKQGLHHHKNHPSALSLWTACPCGIVQTDSSTAGKRCDKLCPQNTVGPVWLPSFSSFRSHSFLSLGKSVKHVIPGYPRPQIPRFF